MLTQLVFSVLLFVPVHAAAVAAPECFSRSPQGYLKNVPCAGAFERQRPATPATPESPAVPARAGGGGSSPSAGSVSAPPPPKAEDVGFRAEFGELQDGSQCIRLVDFVGPGEATSPATRSAEQLFLGSLATMARCTNPDGTPAALPVLASTPGIEAARFWQTMPLPDPVPRIHPGRALVGWGTYLETGGQEVVEANGSTPFGPLAITATRTVTVDWDDGPGSVTGPHTGVGGPWPDGDITWVYGHSGLRDISVTQTWTADWSIGANTGTFTGRGTTATIDDFPVDQIQAVRTR